MNIRILNIGILLVICQQCFVSAFKHHHDGPYQDPDDLNEHPYPDNHGNAQDLSKQCLYIRYDHNKRYTDYMFCPFGCCGNLDDQKCCEDPEKEKGKNDKRGNSHLVHSLLIFAGVMLIIAMSCCVFGIYKHKKAKLRKTSPGRNYETTVPAQMTVPRAIFYTPRSGRDPAGAATKQSPESSEFGFMPKGKTNVPDSSQTPPPRYTQRAPSEVEVPPYSVRSPPPPYSFGISSSPPSATEYIASS